MDVPDNLRWLGRLPGGDAWLESLPELVDHCIRLWELDPAVREPLPSGYVSYVVGVRMPDGRSAVLKVPFPSEETRLEAAALQVWDGRGAVRLLCADPATRAFLLERCRPGTQLLECSEDEAIEVIGRLLQQLHEAPVPPDAPFDRLEDVAPRWMAQVERRLQRLGTAAEQRAFEVARERLDRLLARPAPSCLLHQDLQATNVVDAGQRGWVALDPKPLVGDPAFDVASAARDRRPWLLAQRDPAAIVSERIERLSELSGVDPGRARAWSLVHAFAWGMDDDARYDDVLACVPLLLDA